MDVVQGELHRTGGQRRLSGLSARTGPSRPPRGSLAGWPRPKGARESVALTAPSGTNGSTNTSSKPSRRPKTSPHNGSGLTTTAARTWVSAASHPPRNGKWPHEFYECTPPKMGGLPSHPLGHALSFCYDAGSASGNSKQINRSGPRGRFSCRFI